MMFRDKWIPFDFYSGSGASTPDTAIMYMFFLTTQWKMEKEWYALQSRILSCLSSVSGL